jgi:hypothetical protein
MKLFRRKGIIGAFAILLLVPKPARADLFGGDVVVLTQILAQSLQQLSQLKQLLSTGSENLALLKEVNRGLRDGLNTIQMLEPKFNPGLYGDLDTAERVLAVIQDLYGKIPQGAQARLQNSQDRSVAESIAMNGTLYKFADQADRESKRIIEHAAEVNPQGAAKLTAQSVAVLIGVTTQVLRSNSMMLKLMGENMALSNRKGKLESEQFKATYGGLSNGLGTVGNSPKIEPLKGSR